MSPGSSWCPAYLLVIASLTAASSRSQYCSVEKMENTIININLALSKGVRGTEPVYTSTPDACICACCLEKKLPGDKKCNLMIFDARRTSTRPNCYLFYCPSAEACPTKSAIGLVSYKITRGAGAFISRSPMSHLNHTTALQQSDFHPAAELPNHVAKHVASSEFRTDSPKIQGAKHPESLDSTPQQKVNNLLPTKASFTVQTGNSSTSLPTTQSSVPEPSNTTAAPLPTSITRLQSSMSSLPTAAAKPGALTTTTVTFLPRAEPGSPAASIAATHVLLSSPQTSASTITAKWVTTNGSTEPRWRRPATPWTPATVSSSDTNHVTLLSSSDFILSSNESPTAFQSNHQGYEPSDSESYFLEGLLRREDVIQLGEKSSLVAALLFGVIFLLLVIALTGKKVHESLQKRHYTRLDYLINGMYADV
ncbi:MANSC domain-containing protein 1 isoform X2 [Apteryx rowi]|uniref:MANSC domain-containing protein 1 isoform X2 n=1 Tax=Apteryx rowi TaxID=308060 RepID=UPI000E1C4FA2|nr:MANSC domain-containing protein 1 isoform X2 [Apteryx rowi]